MCVLICSLSVSKVFTARMASTEQASWYVRTWLRKWTGGIDQRHRLCCLLPSQLPRTKASTLRANTYGLSVTREGCCCRGGGSFSWRSLTAVDMKVKQTLPPPTPSCSISRGFYIPRAVSCVDRCPKRIAALIAAPHLLLFLQRVFWSFCDWWNAEKRPS